MLIRLEARNFRALRYVDVPLQSFQVAVGPNASGKSTFFDAFLFVQDIAARRDPRTGREGIHLAVGERSSEFSELTWAGSGDDIEIAIEAALPEEIKEIPMGKDKKNYDFLRYEIRLGFREGEGLIIALENLWLIQEGNRKTLNSRPSELFPDSRRTYRANSILVERRKRTPPGWKPSMRKAPEGSVFVSETTDWNNPTPLGATRSGLANIPDDEERFPASFWLKNLIIRGIKFIHLNIEVMRKPSRPDAPREFLPDGSNLPLVLRTLEKGASDRYAMWVDHLRTALPDVHSVRVVEREEDRHLYIKVRYASGVEVPSWLVSDGSLRLMALTLIPYLSEEGVYFIEEPENGLHPKAVEAVYQSLSSCYKNQVFLASHSPAFLALVDDPKDILCFSKTDKGAVDVVSGADHPRLKQWKKEITLDILFAAGVLG